MKRLKYLVILLAILFVPFAVFAEDEQVTTSGEEQATTTEESKEVNLYFFRGEGCSHCAEAEEWFQSIEAEYGSFFKIVDYETWYNEENAALMEKVAEARGEEASGVPYIIIGDKSWNGFDTDYTEEMLDQIKLEFAKDVSERYDIMKYVESGTTPKKESNDAVILLVILLVCGGLGFGIYQARKNAK